MSVVMEPEYGENPEEYVTLKVKRRVKDALFEIQGLLQYRDHRRYNISEIIEFLLAHAPELQIPISERLRLVEPREPQETLRGLQETPPRT